ncbi:hypothetical protein GCM10020000_71260 [Streptomyces olivoverticillatus]
MPVVRPEQCAAAYARHLLAAGRPPDSLSRQSHRDPDGTGLGYFDPDGTPHVHKAPIAAYDDRSFAEEARQVESATFLAHIRFASTGGLKARNTHPFEQDGGLFAHNGVIEGLDRLEARLGPDRASVEGDTDSERFFALVTRETRAHGGDITAGIEHAAQWIARNLPVYSLNLVLTTRDELWALRYPETHELYVLRRAADGHHGTRHLDHSGTARPYARPLPRPHRRTRRRRRQRGHGRQSPLGIDGAGRASPRRAGPRHHPPDRPPRRAGCTGSPSTTCAPKRRLPNSPPERGSPRSLPSPRHRAAVTRPHRLPHLFSSSTVP